MQQVCISRNQLRIMDDCGGCNDSVCGIVIYLPVKIHRQLGYFR